ncbi:MAG TPA: hypothetical protein PLJ12_16750, partial [Planctomycetota bacterium]|nr:hypothetical protein [Planctomycetota bacterium]
LVLLAGFAIGLLPMGYMAWNVGTALLDVHGTELAQLESNWTRLQSFLDSLYLGVSPWTLLVRVVYPLAAGIAVGWAVGLAKAGRLPEKFLGGFVLLWLLAWYKGPFLADHHVHYFAWLRWAPMILVVLILAARGVDLAWSRGGRLGLAARGLALGVGLLGLAEAGVIVARSQWRTPRTNFEHLVEWKGYNYRGHFRTLLRHLPDGEPSTIANLLGYREVPPDLLYGDLATSVIAQSSVTRSMSEWLEWFAALDAERLPLFVRGMGPGLVMPMGGQVGKALESLENQDPRWRAAFAEAIGYFGSGWAFLPEDIRKEVESIGLVDQRDNYLRGVGARIFRVCVVYPYGRDMVMNPVAAQAYLATMPPGTQSQLLLGFQKEEQLWTLVAPE